MTADPAQVASPAGGVPGAPAAPGAPGAPAAPPDARQLEAEIERTREQLGQTVQELAARADVKSRARVKAAEVSGRLKGTADRVRDSVSARDHWMPVTVAVAVIALDCVAFMRWQRGR